MADRKSSRFAKVYLDFFRHRKTLRLHRLIGEAAYWVPIRLWMHCIERGSSSVSDYTADDLAAVLDFRGDPEAMRAALITAGFLSADGGTVIGWEEEYGEVFRFYTERAKKAAATRWGSKAPSSGSSPPTTKEEKKGEGEVEVEGACVKHASSMLEASPPVAGSVALAIPTSSHLSSSFSLGGQLSQSAAEVLFPWDDHQQLDEVFWRLMRYKYQVTFDYLFRAFYSIRQLKISGKERLHARQWLTEFEARLGRFVKNRKTAPRSEEEASTGNSFEHNHEEVDRFGDFAFLKAAGVVVTPHSGKEPLPPQETLPA